MTVARTGAVRWVADTTRRWPLPVWLLTRFLAVSLSAVGERVVRGDVDYYRQSLHDMFHGTPIADTLREYPLPVLAPMVAQYVVAGGRPGWYLLIFALSMLAVDAAFTWRLRAGGSGLVLWIWFLPLLGTVCWFRFDLMPAVLVGAALLAAPTRPVRSGIAIALAAGLKLWPAAVLPTAMAARTARWRIVMGFLSTAVVLIGGTVLVAGLGRLVSPLRWQADRGLQIESVTATPLMLLRMLSSGTWRVFRSHYLTFEVDGPGSEALTVVSTLAFVAAIAFVIVLWWRVWSVPATSGVPTAWVAIATVLLLVVTDRTLSPQYLLWIAAPLAVLASGGIGRVDRIEGGGRELRLMLGGLLVVAVLTQLEYPILYDGFRGGWRLPVATIVLIVRNAGLVALSVIAVRQAWRATTRRAVVSERAVDLI